MAKARPRDLGEEGVQGGVRQEGHEGPEGLGGLREGGLGGLQEGVQVGRPGGVEPAGLACCSHLTGTLGGERGCHTLGSYLHCTNLYSPRFSAWLLLAGCSCIVVRSMPHRTVTHHMSGNI